MIYTNATIQIDDRLRGEIDDQQSFALRTPGGIYEGKQLWVKGMPEFFPENDRALFFLKKVNNRWSFVRGEMGKINL